MTKEEMTQEPVALAQDIESELRAVGTRERAEGSKRYLKSELEFLGATVPQIRATARQALGRSEPSRDRAVGLAMALWSVPIFERRLAAVEVLRDSVEELDAEELSLIEGLIRDAHTWALVDPLAISVAGPLVERFPELAEVLDHWARDSDFWVRRSSMLALLSSLRRGEGDWQRFSRYADEMLEDREFFIRKAIGWILRETGKGRPELVYEWLRPRASRASGVTMREAVKPLSAEQADELMSIYRER